MLRSENKLEMVGCEHDMRAAIVETQDDENELKKTELLTLPLSAVKGFVYLSIIPISWESTVGKPSPSRHSFRPMATYSSQFSTCQRHEFRFCSYGRPLGDSML